MKFCPQCGRGLAGFGLEQKQMPVLQPEAPAMENLTTETSQHGLGAVLVTHGNRHICEGGVCDKKKSILWDDVDRLFLDGWKLSVNFLPAGESIRIRVLSTTNHEIDFRQKGLFRLGRKAQGNFSNLYEFIVSKIIDRQWSKLTNNIAEGRNVSFDQFHVSSSAIYRKKFFRGYHTIDLHRVAGCHFDSGQFVVDFIDDKGRRKCQFLGPVSEIPNIHLAQTFLTSIARQNSGQ